MKLILHTIREEQTQLTCLSYSSAQSSPDVVQRLVGWDHVRLVVVEERVAVGFGRAIV